MDYAISISIPTHNAPIDTHTQLLASSFVTDILLSVSCRLGGSSLPTPTLKVGWILETNLFDGLIKVAVEFFFFFFLMHIRPDQSNPTTWRRNLFLLCPWNCCFYQRRRCHRSSSVGAVSRLLPHHWNAHCSINIKRQHQTAPPFSAFYLFIQYRKKLKTTKKKEEEERPISDLLFLFCF